MRLLTNLEGKLELREFFSDVPRYAILSHTWVENEEVSFEDMGTSAAEKKAGFQKIQRFCRLAASHNYKFVWVDTCCIDKRSSSELSEAINSMYMWYENADRCYAYLSDVTDAANPELELAASRWFTRGWTLQELVAPHDVVFFGNNGGEWFEIGTKKSLSLRKVISRITKIDASILEDSQGVFKASIAQRMSWASGRKTTRQEDIAYCLLGIFKVNMPLLYGEGENAFTRLQLELLNVPNDHTIFAWSMPGHKDAQEPQPPTSGLHKGAFISSLRSSSGTLGLLAPSVVAFSDCGNVVQSQELSNSSHYMTNIGLCITLPTVLDREQAEYYAFLDCFRRASDYSKVNSTRICLSLRHEGNSRFYRVSTTERTVMERHYLARMTPMFITRTRSNHHLNCSVSRSPIPSESLSQSRMHSEPDEIRWMRWLLRASRKFWTSHGNRGLSDDETAPLLSDSVENVLQYQSSSSHSEQIQMIREGWKKRLLCAFRKNSAFLVSNSTKLLIIFVPLGIFAGAIRLDPSTVFVLNFLAIMALALILSSATKKLSANVEYALGELIKAIFGNAVEMIISIAALRIGQVDIIQWSIMGSITSYILLVLGCCFSVSGMLQLEQTLNFTAASTMLSLMAVALASLILPVALYNVLQKSVVDTKEAILGLSRGVAIVLLVLFCIYLYFQQKSPANFFDIEQPEDRFVQDSAEDITLKYCVSTIALLLIILVTGLMAVCADNVVGSIDSVLERTHITQGFIGFVVLPMIGSTVGPSKAVIAAYNNKLDRAIDVVIGSVMQLTLFVMPSVVLLGWAIDQPMQLEFGFLETSCFFLSVFVVSLLVQDRKISYLGGVICIAIYFMIALTMYFYPDNQQVWPEEPNRP